MLTPSAYPALIHCTQGKDRTGLLLTIILLLLEEVPLSAIKHDYMLSDEGLLPVREKMVKEMTEIGMGEEYSRALETFVEQTKGFLDGYGGVRKYLNGIGFGMDKQEQLVQVLRA
jgi:protein tyrosine/serine phosphatase